MNEFKIHESPGYLLSKGNGLMRNLFNRKIRENGLHATAEQWGILNIVQAFPGSTQSDIATRSIKDKTNITRMLDVLEKNKHIERKPDKNDRRIYRIFITNNGKKLLQQLIPIANEVNELAVQTLADKEIKTLLSALQKMHLNLTNSLNL